MWSSSVSRGWCYNTNLTASLLQITLPTTQTEDFAVEHLEHRDIKVSLLSVGDSPA